jgi:hypothetical protein
MKGGSIEIGFVYFVEFSSDIDGVRDGVDATDLTPAGRAGLSDQFKTHGWRAASAERMALLESLRQVATSWR